MASGACLHELSGHRTTTAASGPMACCHKLWADLEGGHISTDGFQEYLLGISCGKYIDIIYIYIEVKCGKIKTFFFGHEVAQNAYWHPFVIIAVHLQEILSQCICLFFMSMT